MSRKQIGAALWTCDRCGATAESPSTAQAPLGWVMTNGMSRPSLQHKDLCMKCGNDLVEWMEMEKSDESD